MVRSTACDRCVAGLRRGDAAPILNSVQQEVVAKIIDGFNPPDTEIRRRLEQEDPDYDPVAAYAEFAWANGDEFLGNMKFLIDFVNVWPTLTRPFSIRPPPRRPWATS
jgi:hypothetical protein